jgi:hypothetical protein
LGGEDGLAGRSFASEAKRAPLVRCPSSSHETLQMEN